MGHGIDLGRQNFYLGLGFESRRWRFAGQRLACYRVNRLQPKRTALFRRRFGLSAISSRNGLQALLVFSGRTGRQHRRVVGVGGAHDSVPDGGALMSTGLVAASTGELGGIKLPSTSANPAWATSAASAVGSSIGNEA